MSLSVLILLFAVGLVFLAWMRALSIATHAEFPRDLSKRKSFLVKGAFLFVGIAVLDVAAGISGVFSRFDSFPPPFALFFVFNVVLVPGFITFSKFGKIIAQHISERALVGFQSFRIVAELLIFSATLEGKAPIQMSFDGYNPDILTGLFSLGLFFWMKGRSAPRVAFAINVFGVMILAVIGFIAVTSMPGPLRLFLNEPSNIWVTTAPYTLLPGILVSGALTSHMIYFRKRSLLRKRGVEA